jgi:hypothetical protein
MLQKVFEPTSGEELQEWIPNANIMNYSQLKNYDILPDLPIILLYEIKRGFGHWVTILRTPEGIEHFDSYGFVPDDELSFVPEYFKYESNQNYKYLLNLLYRSGEKINYNPYHLQKGDNTATCGRWAVLRNLFNHLTIDQFAKMINKTSKQLKISTDELVSLAI